MARCTLPFVAGFLIVSGCTSASSGESEGSTTSATTTSATSAATTSSSTTAAASSSTTAAATTTPAAPTPRNVVEDFVQRVLVDGKLDAVSSLVSPDLVRKPSTDDGAAGLEASLRAQPPKGIIVHTVVAEEERVGVLFTRPDATVPSGTFEGLDLYTVRNGVIVEQIELGSTANTAAAGALPPTTTRSPAPTSAAEMDVNRKLVTAFYQEVFGKADLAAVDRLVAEGYLQHNPGVEPGRTGLRKLVESLTPSDLPGVGSGGTIVEGDFVINVSELPVAPDFLLVDIFRVEKGMLAEHWDFTPLGTTLGVPGSGPPPA
jgi:predicted SnoaL-like aldol condensation-catalyzing enzyme